MFLDFQSFPPKSHKFSSFNLMKIQLTLIIRSNRLTCGVDYIFKQNFNLRTTKQFLKLQNVYIFGNLETSNIKFSDSIPSKCLSCSWHMYDLPIAYFSIPSFVHKCIFSPNCSVPFTCKNKVSIWRKMLLWEEKHDFVFLTNFQPFPASNEAASKDSLSSEPSPTTLMSEVSSCQYNNTK